MTNTFALSLKQWRGKVPQKIAADILGLPVRTYQNYEEGRNIPDTFKRAAIVNLMGERKADGPR